MSLNPTSFDRKLYLVCYDIVHNRRRNRVAKVLSGYGMRVQKSVFECFLNEARLKTLRQRLKKEIKESEDQIRIYNLGAVIEADVEYLGIKILHRYRSVVVV
ncbi:MAG: CRISPR-associated endonuclease Cas2 [Calditrichia bacterium]